jgi:beta-lactamase superfamily II metal-dependent hydrolase
VSFPSDAPAAETIEVSLFGPGVGECVVLHVGGGRWIVVDSCLDDGRAVALAYLAAIGVAPTSICLVIATHWHDDHIRGLTEVVGAAPGADFVCSAALRLEEFLSLIAASPAVRLTTRLGSGVDEMTSILQRLQERNRHPTWANSNQVILRNGVVQLTSLSPSSATLSRSMLGFAALAPKLKAALKTVPNVSPNETSVVLHLQCDKAVVLLGADLEVTNSGSSAESVGA